MSQFWALALEWGLRLGCSWAGAYGLGFSPAPAKLAETRLYPESPTSLNSGIYSLNHSMKPLIM